MDLPDSTYLTDTSILCDYATGLCDRKTRVAHLRKHFCSKNVLKKVHFCVVSVDLKPVDERRELLN